MCVCVCNLQNDKRSRVISEDKIACVDELVQTNLPTISWFFYFVPAD